MVRYKENNIQGWKCPACGNITICILFAIILCSCTIQNSQGSFSDADSAFDEFFAGERFVLSPEGAELRVDDFEFDESDSNCYRVGARKDVDNDGVVEQIIDGPFSNGFYIDYNNDALSIFPQFEHYGNVTYLDYDDGCRILYWDVNSGIQFYRLIKMDGTSIAEDTQFLYSEEYEDGDTVWKYRINGEEVEEEYFISEINRLLPGYF